MSHTGSPKNPYRKLPKRWWTYSNLFGKRQSAKRERAQVKRRCRSVVGGQETESDTTPT